MRTLLLHIGGMKTGSTAIQNWLRDNREMLLATGVEYPARNEASGVIQSGNGFRLIEKVNDFDRVLRATKESTVLFSSEFLCTEIAESKKLPLVKSILQDHGFDAVSILLFIRNPVEHAVSLWQQQVKRGGYVRTLDDFLSDYDTPILVKSGIHGAVEHLGANLKIYNYSNRKTDLFDIFGEWLNIKLSAPAIKDARVNRSLTYAELVFQMSLNQTLGKSARFLADDLCIRLPAVNASRIVPSENSQLSMLSRLQGELDYVNSFIHDERDRYDTNLLLDLDKEQELAFTVDQLQVMARSLAKEIERRSTMKYLVQEKMASFRRTIRNAIR